MKIKYWVFSLLFVACLFGCATQKAKQNSAAIRDRSAWMAKENRAGEKIPQIYYDENEVGSELNAREFGEPKQPVNIHNHPEVKGMMEGLDKEQQTRGFLKSLAVNAGIALLGFLGIGAPWIMRLKRGITAAKGLYEKYQGVTTGLVSGIQEHKDRVDDAIEKIPGLSDKQKEALIAAIGREKINELMGQEAAKRGSADDHHEVVAKIKDKIA